MNEENNLAQENARESPIWPTLEDTHNSYNGIASNVMDNLGDNDMLFIASHNKDTVKMVKERCFENCDLKIKIQFG